MLITAADTIRHAVTASGRVLGTPESDGGVPVAGYVVGPGSGAFSPATGCPPVKVPAFDFVPGERSEPGTASRPTLATLLGPPPSLPFGVGRADRDRLQEAWIGYLGQWEWDWFATLTFRGEVHPEAADKRFRVWVSKINRELFGPRWSKKGLGIRWVRALELQRRGVIHYHALLGALGLESLRRFDWMEAWEKLAGFARIEPPRDRGIVVAYCSKYVIKGGEIDLGGPLERGPPTLWESGATLETPTPGSILP